MRDLLARTTPSVFEFFFLYPLVALATVFFAIIDITVFDPFVLPAISANYGAEDQLAVGNPYWQTLNMIVLVFGAVAGGFRIVLGKLAGARWSSMLLFMGFIYFIATITMFYFGWLDFYYYSLRGQEVPHTLDWLNNAGFFMLVKPLGEDPQNVERSDLFILMFAGSLVLVSMFLVTIHHHKKGTLQRLGIRR